MAEQSRSVRTRRTHLNSSYTKLLEDVRVVRPPLTD